MIQFYKPNPRLTGSACSFWMNSDNTIMSSMIKQDSWDDKRKVGSFAANKDNPKGRVIVKLSPSEIGGIIDSLESNREFSTYHSSAKQTLQLKFCPYLDKQTSNQKGFSFAVNKQDKEDSTNKVGFIIGFTFAEGRYLKEYLVYLLSKFFASDDAKQAKAAMKLRAAAKQKKSEVKHEVVQSSEESDLVIEEEEEDDLNW